MNKPCLKGACLLACLLFLLSACGGENVPLTTDEIPTETMPVTEAVTKAETVGGALYRLTESPLEAEEVRYYADPDGANAFFVILVDGKYGVVDRDGNRIADCVYDEPFFDPSGALYCQSEDGFFTLDGDGIPQAAGSPGTNFSTPRDLYWMEGAPILLAGGVTDLHTVPYTLDEYYAGGDPCVRAYMRFVGEARQNAAPAREITHLIANYDNNYRTLTYVPGFKSKLYGLMNINEGALLTDFLYDEVSLAPIDGVFAVRQGEKWGYVSETGEEIAPCVYDPVHSYRESAWSLEIGDYTVTRKEVFLPANGYIVTLREGKYGLLKTDGTELVENRFDSLSQVNPDGVFWAKEGNAWYRGEIL